MSLLINSDFRQKKKDAIYQPPQTLKHSAGDDEQYTKNPMAPCQPRLQASPPLNVGAPLGSALPYFLALVGSIYSQGPK